MKKHIFKFTLIIALLSIISVFGMGTGNFAYAADSIIEEVYLGGKPIGIIAVSDGVIVSEIINVTSQNGCFSPALRAGILKGDAIIKVNGKNSFSLEQLNEIIQQTENQIDFTVLRGDKELIISVQPIYDIVQCSQKIGIAVKNNIAGIGTLTYVKNNGSYGALGHQISDSFGNSDIYSHGKSYFCSISGYKTASKNAPGELLGKIDLDKSPIGTIEKNKFCGIFGQINTNEYYAGQEKIKVGNRNEVKPGKAYIVTTIGNDLPQKYEIEIVKSTNQNAPSEKSMLIRITDKKLLSSTNGILQGMSGSPIIQGGKLIGAVTHVLTKDSTMGYGIYIDWMIKES